MNGNWIKLNRRILDWGWYGDINTKVMFIHCQLKANWTAGEWHGVQYDPGEFITSLPSLCEETGLTNQQARTALKHLEATGELTVRTTDRATGKQLNRCRVIQVNKWSQYQGDNSQNDNQLTGNSTGKQQASNRQATAG